MKELFPIFAKHPNLVYFDNAATTHKPMQVIDRLSDFYKNEYGSLDGFYKLSVQATKQYEEAREVVKDFLNSGADNQVYFTKGCTDSINTVAYILENSGYFQSGDEIIVSTLEHHSNMVPWQQIAKRKGVVLKFIPVSTSGELDLNWLEDNVGKKTKLVTVNHVSNSLGTVNDVKKIVEIAHKFNSLILIDGAQAVAHLPVDVEDLNCDFYTFSGHKMYGPMGVGVLWAKKGILDNLEPFQTGGKMVKSVCLQKPEFADSPYRFEAGTPNIADVVGLVEAIAFIKKNREFISKKEVEVLNHLENELKKIKGLRIVGEAKNKVGVVSFVVDGVHPADIGMMLAQKDICIRVGHHCTQPILDQLGVGGTCRVSLGVYNTEEDVDKFVIGLEEVLRMLG